MSKTPFEIRLDLLNLAREILTTPVFENRQSKMTVFGYEKSADPGIKPPTLEEFPTSDQIIAEATKLNNFVSGS